MPQFLGISSGCQMRTLSEHFTLNELTHSDVAARLGIENKPDAATIENLRALCIDILEPLRSAISRSLFVSSGYRSVVLNTAVNGSKSSDHILGFAADVVAPPMSVRALAEAVKTLAPYVPLKQCIIEFGRWVHVSRIAPGKERENDPQFLVASLDDNGATIYRSWEA